MNAYSSRPASSGRLLTCHFASWSASPSWLAQSAPVIASPVGADQELNAQRLTALGARATLDPITLAPDELRVAVSTALASESLLARGPRVRDEIAAKPIPAATTTRLEDLMSPEAGRRLRRRPRLQLS